MKIVTTITLQTFFLMSLTTLNFAQATINLFDSADGVSNIAGAMTLEEIEDTANKKEEKAINYITKLAQASNKAENSEEERDAALYAYTGFMAQLEILRVQHHNLKHEQEELITYSKRLDQLILDLENHLYR